MVNLLTKSFGRTTTLFFAFPGLFLPVGSTFAFAGLSSSESWSWDIIFLTSLFCLSNPLKYLFELHFYLSNPLNCSLTDWQCIDSDHLYDRRRCNSFGKNFPTVGEPPICRLAQTWFQQSPQNCNAFGIRSFQTVRWPHLWGSLNLVPATSILYPSLTKPSPLSSLSSLSS